MSKSIKLSYEIVICITGDPLVGKTSIVQRFIRDSFSKEHIPTEHQKEYNKSIIVNNTRVTTKIYDTSGLDEYDTSRFKTYKGADVFLCVYSLNDPVSMERVKRKWCPELIERGERGVPIIIIANKTDINNKQKNKKMKISSKSQKRLVKVTGGMSHIQISAKKSSNAEINRIFEHASRIAINRKRKPFSFIKKWEKRKKKYLRKKKREKEIHLKQIKKISNNKSPSPPKKNKKSKKKKEKKMQKNKKDDDDCWVFVGDDGDDNEKNIHIKDIDDEEEEVTVSDSEEEDDLFLIRSKKIYDDDVCPSGTFDLSATSSDEEKKEKERDNDDDDDDEEEEEEEEEAIFDFLDLED